MNETLSPDRCEQELSDRTLLSKTGHRYTD